MPYIEPFEIKWVDSDDEKKEDDYIYYKTYFVKKYNKSNLRRAREGIYQLDGDNNLVKWRPL